MEESYAIQLTTDKKPTSLVWKLVTRSVIHCEWFEQHADARTVALELTEWEQHNE